MKIAALISCVGLCAAAHAQPVVLAEQTFDLVGCSAPGNPTRNSDVLLDGGMLTNFGSMNTDPDFGLTYSSFWFQTRDNVFGPQVVGGPNGETSDDFIGAGASTAVFSCGDVNSPNFGADEPIGPSLNPFGTGYNFDFGATCDTAALNPGANEYYFQFNDGDGRIDVVFESIDLSGFTNRRLELYYWVRGGIGFCDEVAYEDGDRFTVTITDGTMSVDVLDLGPDFLNGLRVDEQDGPWELLDVDLDAVIAGMDETQIQLIVSGDTDGSSENIFFDEIQFTGEEDTGGTACNAADLDADGDNDLIDAFAFLDAYDSVAFPAIEPPANVGPAVNAADLDADGDNDLIDAFAFLDAYDTVACPDVNAG